ncbi:hypothetical protein ON010_g7697 [Phytophthora cinnamomi]|nr:hypothetical protein ON010_g7697 [Phytophthora cinnamomi]
MTRRVLLLLGASVASAAFAEPFTSSLDASYVVQLHASRDGYTPPEGGGASLRSQLMTTESGQQFECFLPSLTAAAQEDDLETATNSLTAQEKEEKEQKAAFLAFGRAAAQKVRPKCVQYVDRETEWVYEVCSGLLVRRVALRSAIETTTTTATTATTATETEGQPVEVQVDATGATANPSDKQQQVAGHEVEEMGAFVSDASRPALSYDEFAMPETQDRVKNHRKPLFTQTFGKGEEQIQVQFICSATVRDDAVCGLFGGLSGVLRPAALGRRRQRPVHGALAAAAPGGRAHVRDPQRRLVDLRVLLWPLAETVSPRRRRSDHGRLLARHVRHGSQPRAGALGIGARVGAHRRHARRVKARVPGAVRPRHVLQGVREPRPAQGQGVLLLQPGRHEPPHPHGQGDADVQLHSEGVVPRAVRPPALPQRRAEE